jgi:hypothetical protein
MHRPNFSRHEGIRIRSGISHVENRYDTKSAERADMGKSPDLMKRPDESAGEFPVSIVCNSRTDLPLCGAQQSKKLRRLLANLAYLGSMVM